jgi:hypothetical protein
VAAHHPLAAILGPIVLVALLTTSCAGAVSKAQPTITRASESQSASEPLPAAPRQQHVSVPSKVSNFPPGIYRVQLKLQELEKLGWGDPGSAGVWTLTVTSGLYQLDCIPVADPAVDCGNHDPALTSTVEMGSLHGTSPTVWFVHDMARLSKVTGCTRHIEGSQGCGGEGGYHLNWKRVPHGIAFSHFVGLGDEAGEGDPGNWLAKPWVQIS